MNDQLKNILEQQLRDVHAPDAVSWWPLAIGWWIAIAAILLALAVSVTMLVKHRRRNKYRKLAVNSLDQHLIDWKSQKNNAGYLQAANTVLKRTCRHFDASAMSFSNKKWIDFLNAHSNRELSHNSQIALTEQLYQASPEVDIEHLHEELKTWLLKHSVVPSKPISEVENA